MKRLPEIECPRCNGEGHIELPRALSETLLAVSKAAVTNKGATLLGVQKLLPKVNTPAIKERLRALGRLSLVSSEKTGRVTFYTITSKK